jgi:tetratricopeptide (TPR) repeat protein
MGEVFLAEDTRLNRQVAIKFLVTPADEASRRRLLREARAAAALEHPSIVGIYEIGSDPAGGDFIVMPYVLGETLATRLRHGALSVDDALALGAQISSALALAHHHGIVHRDLKPQNIIVTPAGSAMLLDFGLAKHVEGSHAAADAETVSPITEARALVGTSGYMAPEQLRGGAVDRRSDLFALGCVLYECLTGRRAFSGSSSADVVGQVLHIDPAPPSTVRTDNDSQADALCAQLLQKSPADRFQSADEVLGAIRVIQTARGPHSGSRSGAAMAARPPSQVTEKVITKTVTFTVPTMRMVAGIFAAVVVTAGIVFGIWQWQRPMGLPAPKPEAMRSYTLALEALREGSYQVAQGNLQEALRLDATFALAYVRIAEAYSELDRLSLAIKALAQVGPLIPNRGRLSDEDALLLTAVESYVFRRHDQAIAAYSQLAERTPRDPRVWVDLGRAEDNAGRRISAREHFERARDLDKQYAPARVRLGTLLGQLGRTDEALAEFAEAIRLYRTASNTEGVAEAMVRRGTALTSASRYPEARRSVNEALSVAVGPGFAFQRVRALFDQARLTSINGQFVEGTAIAERAVAEAKRVGLFSSAASGLREMASTLTYAERLDEAAALLSEAIDLAKEQSAERAEMLARLQLADLRNRQGRSQDALSVSDGLEEYFERNSYPRNQGETVIIRARAYEDLEDYSAAEHLTRRALQIAETNADSSLLPTALENLAGQLEILGRFPDALRERERVEAIYRAQGNLRNLPYSLVNHANLLSRLGRGREALPIIEELEKQIAAGAQAYQSRRTPTKLARAYSAVTTGDFAAVSEPAAEAQVEARSAGAGSSAVQNSWVARALDEYAAARQGRRGLDAPALAALPDKASSTAGRLDLAYWAAQSLMQRGDFQRAADVALTALALPGAAKRPELHWRVTSVAAAALSRFDSARSATIRAAANAALDELRKTWDPQALATYLARADLVGLSTR